MSCTCVNCPDCGGSGRIWRAFDGTYLGRNRSDDFDESEFCEWCEGTGIVEMCDECREAMEEGT